MNAIWRFCVLLSLALIMGPILLPSAATFSGGPRAEDAPQSLAPLRYLNARDLAIRLFYLPPERDHTYAPTIFHGVDARDLSFGCWVYEWPRGTDVFVASHEMASLIKSLAKLQLTWQEFNKPTSFNPEPAEPGSPMKYKFPVPRGKGVQVDVTCLKGSATSEIPRERICTDMPSLEEGFETPRGLYSIQLIEWDAGCKTPGFDPTKLPEQPARSR